MHLHALHLRAAWPRESVLSPLKSLILLAALWLTKVQALTKGKTPKGKSRANSEFLHLQLLR